MSGKFDLGRAKSGESVLMLCGDGWNAIHFVGTRLDGAAVLEMRGGIYYVSNYDDLRMAPKKITVRYRVALLLAHGDPYTITVQDEHDEDVVSHKKDFIQWLDEWQTVEVPQPDDR